jgi:hypothetical protein
MHQKSWGHHWGKVLSRMAMPLASRFQSSENLKTLVVGLSADLGHPEKIEWMGTFPLQSEWRRHWRRIMVAIPGDLTGNVTRTYLVDNSYPERC